MDSLTEGTTGRLKRRSAVVSLLTCSVEWSKYPAHGEYFTNERWPLWSLSVWYGSWRRASVVVGRAIRIVIWLILPVIYACFKD
jgi:hypothetical protein